MVEERRKRRMIGAEVIEKYGLQIAMLVNACKGGLSYEDQEGNKYDTRTLAFRERGMERNPCEGEEVIYDGEAHPGKLILEQGRPYVCHFITKKSIFKIEDIEACVNSGAFAQAAPEEQLITGAKAMETYDLAYQELVSFWENGLRCYDSTEWGFWWYDYYTNGSMETEISGLCGLRNKLFKIADVEAYLIQIESEQGTQLLQPQAEPPVVEPTLTGENSIQYRQYKAGLKVKELLEYYENNPAKQKEIYSTNEYPKIKETIFNLLQIGQVWLSKHEKKYTESKAVEAIKKKLGHISSREKFNPRVNIFKAYMAEKHGVGLTDTQNTQ